jgi:hypothetical protein
MSYCIPVLVQGVFGISRQGVKDPLSGPQMTCQSPFMHVFVCRLGSGQEGMEATCDSETRRRHVHASAVHHSSLWVPGERCVAFLVLSHADVHGTRNALASDALKSGIT